MQPLDSRQAARPPSTPRRSTTSAWWVDDLPQRRRLAGRQRARASAPGGIRKGAAGPRHLLRPPAAERGVPGRRRGRADRVPVQAPPGRDRGAGAGPAMNHAIPVAAFGRRALRPALISLHWPGVAARRHLRFASDQIDAKIRNAGVEQFTLAVVDAVPPGSGASWAPVSAAPKAIVYALSSRPDVYAERVRRRRDLFGRQAAIWRRRHRVQRRHRVGWRELRQVANKGGARSRADCQFRSSLRRLRSLVHTGTARHRPVGQDLPVRGRGIDRHALRPHLNPKSRAPLPTPAASTRGAERESLAAAAASSDLEIAPGAPCLFGTPQRVRRLASRSQARACCATSAPLHLRRCTRRERVVESLARHQGPLCLAANASAIARAPACRICAAFAGANPGIRVRTAGADQRQTCRCRGAGDSADAGHLRRAELREPEGS